MFENKYSNVLTVILVIVIIAIIVLLGYFGFEMLQKNSKEDAAQQAIEQYDKMYQNKTENTIVENSTSMENVVNPYESLQNQVDSNTNKDNKVYMEDYEVMGTITIPATGAKYPILERVTKRSIEIAVAILYPERSELNQPGNVVIAGHNYRNGTFFSDNKKLKNGDKIYIKDKTGTTVTYIIYDIFETSPDDADYMLREIGDKREISLSTCTDDVSGRLIILAREQ